MDSFSDRELAALEASELCKAKDYDSVENGSPHYSGQVGNTVAKSFQPLIFPHLTRKQLDLVA